MASQGDNTVRKPRPYAPSPWPDNFFLDHKPCIESQYLAMKDMAQVRKEQVRKIILDASASSNLALKLELVDTLQRIGLGYHYGKEIGELLHDVLMYVKGDKEDCDGLHVTGLRFYLLRKNGYNVSSDVFLKFTDGQGNFASNDVNSLLTLYDAAHLRIHEEEILDNAIIFAKSHLQSMMEYLEPELAKEVQYTLETPRFRRVERIEARRYMSIYENMATHDETILEFAKLDFNILQTLYCKELKSLTMWWKDLKSQSDLQFARDRVVEMHFWMLGVFCEPQYSYSRIMITKMVLFMSLFDDLFDNYSTTEEGNNIVAAMERWDEQAVEQLPSYFKELYVNILNTINDIIEELKDRKNTNADLVKKLVIEVARVYHAELKWRDEQYVPANVEEHLQISVCSSVCMHITSLSFILLGDMASREVLDWAFTYPKIVRGVCIVGRIGNDIVSHEREQSSEHMVSTVQTCMKQHGITIEQANEKLRAITEEAWMDIVEECLEQKHPMALLERAVHLGRTMDFMYKREDAYTLSFSLKDTIDSLYVNFV